MQTKAGGLQGGKSVAAELQWDDDLKLASPGSALQKV